MLSVPEAGERVQRTCSLTDGVSRLRYVSGARQEALERMGIVRVRDLFLHLPHRYLDFSTVVPIARAQLGQDATIVGTVDRVQKKRPRPRMQIVEVSLLDPTGVLMVSFFRQPWVADQLHQGDRVAVSGKVEFSYGFRRMSSPFFEVLGAGEDSSNYARVLPVHPVTEGLSVSWARRIVSEALASRGDVCDPVPASLVSGHNLMTLARALREVHFPRTLATAERARRRLAYDELLCLQLTLLTRQRMELAGVQPQRHVTDGPCLKALLDAMPFSLTDEQRTATRQILDDMASPHVMNRLLLGDVGTGKTAVAACAIACVADTDTQACVMAPTSVLASQYAAKLGPLFDRAHICWALATGSTPAAERARTAELLRQGQLDCLFGTTAVLSDDLEFCDLTLVVIDEQHRFGVAQRTALRRKGPGADLLAMTATPIPRTLALSLYGDIECSRIAHRPRPGAGVTTKVVASENVDLAFGAIRDACAQGHQAYVICPLVDETDDGSQLDDVPQRNLSNAKRVHAAVTTAQDLQRNALKGLRVEVLTGRMTPAQKDDVMARFRDGSIDVLVSTTVVEVGVDVPNATAMLVYDADRFGLATLHQLRGRVGRGDDAGVVYLECAARKQSPARTRLAALEQTSDGFALAELDLKLRREGEVLGYRQHGGVSLRISDLANDADLVEYAHADARRIAQDDPALSSDEHRALALECRDRFGAYFEEVEHA